MLVIVLIKNFHFQYQIQVNSISFDLSSNWKPCIENILPIYHMSYMIISTKILKHLHVYQKYWNVDIKKLSFFVTKVYNSISNQHNLHRPSEVHQTYIDCRMLCGTLSLWALWILRLRKIMKAHTANFHTRSYCSDFMSQFSQSSIAFF